MSTLAERLRDFALTGDEDLSLYLNDVGEAADRIEELQSQLAEIVDHVNTESKKGLPPRASKIRVIINRENKS